MGGPGAWLLQDAEADFRHMHVPTLDITDGEGGDARRVGGHFLAGDLRSGATLQSTCRVCMPHVSRPQQSRDRLRRQLTIAPVPPSRCALIMSVRTAGCAL